MHSFILCMGSLLCKKYLAKRCVSCYHNRKATALCARIFLPKAPFFLFLAIDIEDRKVPVPAKNTNFL